jgi:hypothetical protein
MITTNYSCRSQYGRLIWGWVIPGHPTGGEMYGIVIW